jgi:hypothetical protein
MLGRKERAGGLGELKGDSTLIALAFWWFPKS